MAVTELRAQPMARKKRASEESPPTIPIKVDRGIAAKAKIVASDRGVDLASYVSETLRATVERDWSRIVKRIDLAEGEK
jgi:CHASE3 domain sensor protein